jgi:hypothetical protein
MNQAQDLKDNTHYPHFHLYFSINKKRKNIKPLMSTHKPRTIAAEWTR